MDDMNYLDWASVVFVIVGALNWGLVGLGELGGFGNLNLVNMVLGSVPVAENLVYLVVGLSGLYAAYMVYDKQQ